jgi:hypothetical protein
MRAAAPELMDILTGKKRVRQKWIGLPKLSPLDDFISLTFHATDANTPTLVRKMVENKTEKP